MTFYSKWWQSSVEPQQFASPLWEEVRGGGTMVVSILLFSQLLGTDAIASPGSGCMTSKQFFNWLASTKQTLSTTEKYPGNRSQSSYRLFDTLQLVQTKSRNSDIAGSDRMEVHASGISAPFDIEFSRATWYPYDALNCFDDRTCYWAMWSFGNNKSAITFMFLRDTNGKPYVSRISSDTSVDCEADLSIDTQASTYEGIKKP